MKRWENSICSLEIFFPKLRPCYGLVNGKHLVEISWLTDVKLTCYWKGTLSPTWKQFDSS
jgi:hypothetical protein